jgi:hypothetical protein
MNMPNMNIKIKASLTSIAPLLSGDEANRPWDMLIALEN